jgi:hypothetical protein
VLISKLDYIAFAAFAGDGLRAKVVVDGGAAIAESPDRKFQSPTTARQDSPEGAAPRRDRDDGARGKP